MIHGPDQLPDEFLQDLEWASRPTSKYPDSWFEGRRCLGKLILTPTGVWEANAQGLIVDRDGLGNWVIIEEPEPDENKAE